MAQGTSDVTEDALRGISGGKAVGAVVEGLSFCFQSLANATHLLGQLGGLFVVGTEMFDFAGQGLVVLLPHRIVDGQGINELVDEE